MPVKDPVCWMTVDEESAPARSTFMGRSYFFCCGACKDQFDANAASYVGASDEWPVSA